MRIKPGRDNDDIGIKLPTHLLQGGFKSALLIRSRSGRAQGQIQGVAKPAASPLLAARSSAWIPRILVRRKKENRRIVVKDSLRPVAVMHIPIDNRHALDFRVVPLGVTRRHSYVIEKTKTHRSLSRRMMARR